MNLHIRPEEDDRAASVADAATADACSVILTTVTDVVGFFAFLGLATVLLL
jgi:hypothetical protein